MFQIVDVILVFYQKKYLNIINENIYHCHIINISYAIAAESILLREHNLLQFKIHYLDLTELNFILITKIY